ncbi:MAG: DEAD/DEAH box helicase family protein [Patulibacter sp.]
MPPDAQPSNFAFLRAERPDLYRRAREVERRVFFDPRAACVEGRITLEEIVRWLYEIHPDLEEPYRPDLRARIATREFKALVGDALFQKADLIRINGNRAAHDGRVRITDRDSLTVVRELYHLLYWVARAYNTDRVTLTGAKFDLALVPRPRSPQERAKAAQLSREKLRQLQEEQDARNAELAHLRETSDSYQQQIESLQAELAALKAQNDATPIDHDLDEATTRDAMIDVLLAEAGWDVSEPDATEYEVDGMARKTGDGTGRGFVDYVLWGDDGQPLALVEAKRTRRSPTEGEQQAVLYADQLERRFGRRPVVYLTNGYEHWFWDEAEGPKRRVAGFRTKAELETLHFRHGRRKPLADTATNTEIVERAYQERAIRSVCDAIEQGHRGALLVMATGTGKTRTVIALVDVLMRAGLVQRTLFLADRQALVKQATNAFKAHLPQAATVNLLDATGRDQEGRVFVATYPTIMNLISRGAEGEERRFGPGYFDLVIVDEAHRSVYKKYRAIFAYFDALLIGLTATPRDEVHRDTYRIFGLEPGVPTDQYGLAEAVDDGYLVPPVGIDVPLKFPRDGARYSELSDEEQEQWDELEWDDEAGGAPDEVSAADVNQYFFNIDTVDKVLEVLMGAGEYVAGGDRLGKTIIFAKNQRHAEFIIERFDANYPHLKGQFARVITHKVEHAQDLIDRFSMAEEPPHIAVSVDMLDTGIDVPEVVNLVFFKVVRSSTKFWQMVGRGTRLRPDLFGPGADKRRFNVFDICGNLAFFNLSLPSPEGAPAKPLRQRLFEARVDLLELIDTGGTDADAASVRESVAEHLRAEVQGMPRDNFVVRPHLREVERFSNDDAWRAIDAEAALDLREQLSPLPTAVLDRDEAAKRFDLLMLHLQRRVLNPDPRDARRQEQVQQIAGALLEQPNVPAVAKQLELLSDLAGDEWWDDVTIPMLEQARLRVRDLARLIQSSRRAVVYTDFADDLGDIEVVDIGLPGSSDFVRFQEKVRLFLRQHDHDLTLIKLRTNQALTEVDLARLQEMLLQAGVGTREDLARATNAAQGLGLFVRGLVGLDRIVAREAIDEFIAGRRMTQNQLRFLDEIVQHLTRNGVVNRSLLYESPFSELAPGGPDELFEQAEIIELFGTLDRVRAKAQAQTSPA